MIDKIIQKLNLEFIGFKEDIEFYTTALFGRYQEEDSLYKNVRNKIIAIRYEQFKKVYDPEQKLAKEKLRGLSANHIIIDEKV